MDSNVLPGSTTPGINRTAIDHEFDFASDTNNHRFKVSYQQRPSLRLTQAINFALQSANELGATNWVNVTNTPGIAGTNYVVEVQPPASPAFFRLAR